MTEAQKCLYHIAENMRMDKSISKEGYEYFQQAIKALEQTSCEDAIGRQAALDLCDRFDGSVPYSVLSNYNMLPSVTPQPKIGHWTYADVDGNWAMCGCCNRLNYSYGNYCKHCGAKMVEPQEREDKV